MTEPKTSKRRAPKSSSSRKPSHKTGTREEWLAARLDLLEAEKALTRRSDELARQRQELPWLRIDKEYRFDTDEGPASLADLFRGRSQLLTYHFMFGPEYTAGCPLCSVSRAPLAKLQAYKRRMGWSFPWASSFDSDFNYDFQTTHTKEQQQSGAVEYNFHRVDMRPELEAAEEGRWVDGLGVGVDWATYRQEAHGLSSFAREDGVVYRTYSAYARGVDGLWGMYQWLDRAPLGRNDTGLWWRRHDEYDR